MVVPDNIFASHSWLEINIFMLAKRNTKNGVLTASLKQMADEFGVTRGKVNYILQKLNKEGLLSNTLQTPCKHFANSTHTESQEVTGALQTACKQSANTLQTLGQRKHSFGERLVPYMEQYGKDLIRQFFDYWTETNDGGSKMRFEKEKTFEVAKRLARWHKNNYNKQKSSSLPIGMNLQNSKDKEYEKGLERWNQ